MEVLFDHRAIFFFPSHFVTFHRTLQFEIPEGSVGMKSGLMIKIGESTA